MSTTSATIPMTPHPPAVVQLVRLVAAIRSGDFSTAKRLRRELNASVGINILIRPECRERLLQESRSSRSPDEAEEREDPGAPTIAPGSSKFRLRGQGSATTPSRGRTNTLR